MPTLGDLTPEQRAEYIGGWVEDQAGNLRIYINAIGVYEDVTAYHDASTAHTWCPALRQFSRFGTNENYIVRDDLPRAWGADGKPVPGEWEHPSSSVDCCVFHGLGGGCQPCAAKDMNKRRFVTDWEKLP